MFEFLVFYMQCLGCYYDFLVFNKYLVFCTNYFPFCLNYFRIVQSIFVFRYIFFVKTVLDYDWTFVFYIKYLGCQNFCVLYQVFFLLHQLFFIPIQHIRLVQNIFIFGKIYFCFVVIIFDYVCTFYSIRSVRDVVIIFAFIVCIFDLLKQLFFLQKLFQKFVKYFNTM